MEFSCDYFKLALSLGITLKSFSSSKLSCLQGIAVALLIGHYERSVPFISDRVDHAIE